MAAINNKVTAKLPPLFCSVAAEMSENVYVVSISSPKIEGE